MPHADHGQAVRSLEPGQGLLHGLERLAGPFQLAGDQVGDDLGIGLALEDETLRLEFPPQHRVVFDHPIVHDRDSVTIATAAQVRMGIAIGGRSVRCPARMADPASTRQGMLLEHLFQDPYPAGALPHLEVPIVDRRQPRAIVAAILEPAQARDQDRAGVMHSRVTDNSTHRLESLLLCCGPPEPSRREYRTRILECFPSMDRDPHYQFSMKLVNRCPLCLAEIHTWP